MLVVVLIFGINSAGADPILGHQSVEPMFPETVSLAPSQTTSVVALTTNDTILTLSWEMSTFGTSPSFICTIENSSYRSGPFTSWTNVPPEAFSTGFTSTATVGGVQMKVMESQWKRFSFTNTDDTTTEFDTIDLNR